MKNSSLAILCCSALIWPLSARAATTRTLKPTLRRAATTRSVTAAKLKPVLKISLNKTLLLKAFDKVTTVEGFYYDGSIPMLVDDINRVAQNKIMPDGSYVPLDRKLTSVRAGDRVSLVGKLVKPTARSSAQFRNQFAVLELEATPQVSVLERAARPILFDRRVVFNPKLIWALKPNNYAILIVGGWDAAHNYLRYWNELKATYTMLVARGWPTANIKVIYADGAHWPGDASIPVHYSATKANINAAFAAFAAKMKFNDKLYVMLNDHGGSGPSGAAGDETLALWNHVEMRDNEFGAAVNLITNYGSMIIQMEQCYSGGFVDNLTAPKRVVVSACTATQSSWALPPNYTWNWCTYFWLAALTGTKPDGAGAVNADANGDGKVSMLEAFNYARSHDQGNEIPQYEDNGALPAHSGAMPAGGEGTLGAATFLQ